MNGTSQRAIVRLPKRQREALELLELERLSYAQIAAKMGTSQDSVAQLIARGRINLYDELRGTPLASVAAPSAECERSLPLIAAREDGQLDPTDADAAWLDAHLAGCDRCRPAVGQMAEAAASYRAGAAPGGAAASATARPPAPGGAAPRRRTAALAATSLAVVLLAGLAAVLVGDEGAPAPAGPAAEAAPATGGGDSSPARLVEADRTKEAARRKKSESAGGEAGAVDGQATGGATVETAPTSFAPAPPAGGDGAQGGTSHPNRPSGKAAVNPPKQASSPKPSSMRKPAPAPAQASQPAPEPPPEAPPAEASPPAEEAPDRPGRSGEAPGKPADRPSR